MASRSCSLRKVIDIVPIGQAGVTADQGLMQLDDVMSSMRGVVPTCVGVVIGQSASNIGSTPGDRVVGLDSQIDGGSSESHPEIFRGGLVAEIRKHIVYLSGVIGLKMC